MVVTFIFQNEIKGTQNKLDNIANDEANLEAKIEKKKAELERNNKRLKSLQNVRPAFMDEFEKLEGDLKKLYDVYMEKFRNLTYLEQIVDAYDRQQQVKVEVGVFTDNH
jgi:clusterin-associated protein 1